MQLKTNKDSVLLIAGKGHEDYQEIKEKNIFQMKLLKNTLR